MADLSELLDEVHSQLNEYVALPSDHEAVAVSLFIAATHAQPAWEHATRLVVKSPLKRCGKTRLLEVCSHLIYHSLRTTNISTAALVRSIDKDDPPTLVLDEGDAIFTKRRGVATESAEDLRGILNAGHARGWPYIRWDAQRRQREMFPTFAMAAIACIGDLPDTIEDRAVIVSMRRRARGETVKQWRMRQARPPLENLRERLHAAIQPHLAALEAADPDMPVEDRAADVWAPLIAVADLADSSWPERARQACTALTSTSDTIDEATAGERLLHDLKTIFDESGHDHLSTTHLLTKLHVLDESPWGDWYGHPLNPRDLAKLLRPYGVRSRTDRPLAGDLAGSASSSVKGYRRSDLADPWGRYVTVNTPEVELPDRGGSPQPAQQPQHESGNRPEAKRPNSSSETDGVAPPESPSATVRNTANPVADVADDRNTTATEQTQELQELSADGCVVADVADVRLKVTGDVKPTCPICGLRNTSGQQTHPTCSPEPEASSPPVERFGAAVKQREVAS